METVGLWKLYLETRMNEIMPYYNKLYETEARQFDFLQDVDLWETGDEKSNRIEQGIFGSVDKKSQTDTDNTNQTTDNTFNSNVTDNGSHDLESTTNTKVDNHAEGETTNTSTTDSTTTGTQNTINTNFPQAKLSDTDYASDGANSNSTGTAQDTTNSTTNTTQTEDNTSDQNQNLNETTENQQVTKNTNNTVMEQVVSRQLDSTGNYNSQNDVNENRTANQIRHRAGLGGNRSYAQLLQEYRNSLINIDLMVIDELSDLFMLVY